MHPSDPVYGAPALRPAVGSGGSRLTLVAGAACCVMLRKAAVGNLEKDMVASATRLQIAQATQEKGQQVLLLNDVSLVKFGDGL